MSPDTSTQEKQMSEIEKAHTEALEKDKRYQLERKKLRQKFKRIKKQLDKPSNSDVKEYVKNLQRRTKIAEKNRDKAKDELLDREKEIQVFYQRWQNEVSFFRMALLLNFDFPNTYMSLGDVGAFGDMDFENEKFYQQEEIMKHAGEVSAEDLIDMYMEENKEFTDLEMSKIREKMGLNDQS